MHDKPYEKDQQTNNSFGKLHRNCLQESLNDKNDYESQCNISTKFVDETEN